ncbi:MAG: FHA domain-containing protein [Myxococcales bacterium]
MSQCPRCKIDNPLGAVSCQSCGSPLVSWGRMLAPGEAAAKAPRPRPSVTVRVVRADGGPEAAFMLKKDEALVGSAGDILLMDDPFVARAQARLYFQGGALMVEDVGGGNGVFARIRAESALAAGSEIRCGRQRLVLEPMAPPCEPPTWGSPDRGYRARLVQLLEGGRRGDAFALREGDNLLGREVGDITFPGDGFVSGRHAVVTVSAGLVKIRDAGSSNGTFLRLGAPMHVNQGDHLLIGRHLLKLDVAPAA